MEIRKIKCERCEYEWIPRQPEIIVCPKCKSPYWNKLRKEIKNTK